MSIGNDPFDPQQTQPAIPQPPPPLVHSAPPRADSLRASLATVPTPIWIVLGALGVLMVAVIVVALTTLTRSTPIASVPTPIPTTSGSLPAIVVSPPTVVPGLTVVVSGSRFTPNDPIKIFLRDPARPSDPILQLGTAGVAGDGSFAATFVYPTDPRWANVPRVDVIVQSASTGLYVTSPLNVQAGIIVTSVPTSVGIGTRAPMPTLTPLPITPTPAPPALTPFPTLTSLPTWTWTPPPPTWTPVPVITDWRGEYFNTANLTGSPVVVRNDKNVNFNWGTGSPDPNVPVDYFSARWTRTLNFEGRLYRFSAQADDGVRVYIDNTLIIDEWHAASPLVYTKDVNLAAGLHNVRVEYYDGVLDAYISFKIEAITSFAGWKGEYYDNKFLGGTPKLTRDDAAIAFDWGVNAPGLGLPADNFSVRWTRTISLTGGVYRFIVRVDDGARVLVDDNLVINEWHDASGQASYQRDVNLAAGTHKLVVEYYESVGNARIALTYQPPPIDITNWRGEYFANDNWAGYPTVIRNDDQLGFDWAFGSPDPLLPVDHFSARYTRSVELAVGEYQFDILVDDGVRFYVDNLLVLDQVREQAATPYSIRLVLSQGRHDFKIDYVDYTGQARLAWSRTPLSVTPTPTTAPLAPTINVFTVAPPSIQPGGCVTITWQVSNATLTRLVRNASVLQDNIAFNGSAQDCPAVAPGSVIYRIEAFNAANQSAFREQAVTVRTPPTVTPAPPQPQINSFTASADQITLGQCVTLTWSTSGATTPIALEVNGQLLQTNLPEAGSTSHCPGDGGMKVYTLIITSGPNNGPISKTTIVNVTQ